MQGEGVKIIIPSNITDTYARLEFLLGITLSGHTDFLTESSNLIDEIYKRVEIQTEQQFRNVLDKFRTNKMELPIKLSEKEPSIGELKLREHVLIGIDKSLPEAFIGTIANY